MIFESQKLIGLEDENYNEIITQYKESILKRSSEPPSPIKKSLVTDDSPMMSKKAHLIKKNLRKDLKARFKEVIVGNNLDINLTDSPKEITRYSKVYYMIDSLKIDQYFEVIPELYK